MSLSFKTSVFVAGHQGMVGRALVRALQKLGGVRVLTVGRSECDLTKQAEVETWFAAHRPEVAIIAAAKVGGIHANATYPADFLYDNIMIAANCVHAAFRHGTQRLLFLGSSCIYPRLSPQPIREDGLLTAPLETTNEAYAVAKIAGLKLCQHYRAQHGVLFHSAMPTNLYGPGDNYHPANSHVIPGLLRRFHEAKEANAPSVTCWGTGAPRREFLFVDDLAAGCLHLLGSEDPPDWVNIGAGTDITIRELVEEIRQVTGYEGEIVWDHTRPDGTPRKLMDSSLINSLGWQPKVDLRAGLGLAYEDFLSHLKTGDARL